MTERPPVPQASSSQALTWFRVMAVVTGSFLLLVVVDMIVKYGGEWVFDWRNEAFIQFSSMVAIIHGWIYMVYLVTVLRLWLAMRWGWRRLFAMVMGGVIPLLSFFLERKITAEVAASLDP